MPSTSFFCKSSLGISPPIITLLRATPRLREMTIDVKFAKGVDKEAVTRYKKWQTKGKGHGCQDKDHKKEAEETRRVYHLGFQGHGLCPSTHRIYRAGPFTRGGNRRGFFLMATARGSP